LRESLMSRSDPRESFESQVKGCHLCGLPIGRSKVTQVLKGEVLDFCCPGCLNVFLILTNRPEGTASDFKETDLYRACVEFGLIPGKKEFAAAKNTAAPPESPAGEELAEAMALRVEGMWCPACSWVIEEALRKTEGVVEARVIFLSDRAQIKYLPQRVDPPTLLAQISRLGYRATSFADRFEKSPEERSLFLRLGISSILTMNIMMISFFLYYGFFEELGQEAVRYFSYPLWFLSTAVLCYGGLPILKRAYHGIRYGSASMDLLITIGALAAYFYSVVQIARGGLHVYFDTASMLITLVLLGRYIEAKAREKVSTGVKELYELAIQKVRLSDRGRERWVSPEAVEPGEEFLVLAGERVPLDGRITSGRAKIDESVLTGESRPITKDVGDEIMGGTLVLQNELKVQATRTGRESSLGQMIELVQEALSKKNPFELLSDRIMRWFVPAVLALAAGTALFLRFRGASVDVALLRAVTVLVITCPCALGIASPLVKVAAIGKGRRSGILIRDPKALEQAKGLDVLILDKTGTMTEGNFSLIDLVSGRTTMEEALSRIAPVEMHSDHFLAREIIRKTKELALGVAEAEGFEAWDGQGVRGFVEGKEVLAGNRLFMRNQGLDLPIDLDEKGRLSESQGMTVVFFGWERKVQGFLLFGDSLKPTSRKAVRELQRRGIELRLVSGDAEGTTRAVARELGIERVSGEALPNEKVEIIRALQKKGKRVGMVGDGFNDAAALVQADVGFGLGTSVNVSREASDVTLMTGDPARITEVLDLSSLTVRIIRQNLLFAFFYNGLGLPLAVAGLLNPLVAVIAMFGSSLSVIGNSFRIFKASGSS
jgi:heavy metal translocating P-type ATPase